MNAALFTIVLALGSSDDRPLDVAPRQTVTVPSDKWQPQRGTVTVPLPARVPYAAHSAAWEAYLLGYTEGYAAAVLGHFFCRPLIGARLNPKWGEGFGDGLDAAKKRRR